MRRPIERFSSFHESSLPITERELANGQSDDAGLTAAKKSRGCAGRWMDPGYFQYALEWQLMFVRPSPKFMYLSSAVRELLQWVRVMGRIGLKLYSITTDDHFNGALVDNGMILVTTCHANQHSFVTKSSER